MKSACPGCGFRNFWWQLFKKLKNRRKQLRNCVKTKLFCINFCLEVSGLNLNLKKSWVRFPWGCKRNCFVPELTQNHNTNKKSRLHLKSSTKHLHFHKTTRPLPSKSNHPFFQNNPTRCRYHSRASREATESNRRNRGNICCYFLESVSECVTPAMAAGRSPPVRQLKKWCSVKCTARGPPWEGRVIQVRRAPGRKVKVWGWAAGDETMLFDATEFGGRCGVWTCRRMHYAKLVHGISVSAWVSILFQTVARKVSTK